MSLPVVTRHSKGTRVHDATQVYVFDTVAFLPYTEVFIVERVIASNLNVRFS
jgi:hypothetical protein